MPIYNVPVELLAQYRSKDIIIRSDDPSLLAKAVQDCDIEKIFRVELTRIDCHPQELHSILSPIDLIMADAKLDKNLLDLKKELKNQDVRLVIPVTAGIYDAVHQAGSAGFAVKLEFTNPQEAPGDELQLVLNYFLHDKSLTRPVEFFHGLLKAFYQKTAATIWQIQEEDPKDFLFVGDDGSVLPSRRVSASKLSADPQSFLRHFKSDLLVKQAECAECKFFSGCIGYFKVPEYTFPCTEIKDLLQSIKVAAGQLENHYEEYLAKVCNVIVD